MVYQIQSGIVDFSLSAGNDPYSCPQMERSSPIRTYDHLFMIHIHTQPTISVAHQFLIGPPHCTVHRQLFKKRMECAIMLQIALGELG